MRNSTVVCFIILMILVLATGEKLEDGPEWSRCPTIEEHPPSTCIKSLLSMRLKGTKEFDNNIRTCGFYPPYAEELICCPDHLSDKIGKGVIDRNEHIIHKFLGSLQYLDVPDYVDYVERYTTIPLSKTYVLGTSKTLDQPEGFIPVNAIVGTNSTAIEITNNSNIHTGLALFGLKYRIGNDVIIPTLCEREDLLNFPLMYAFAFARQHDSINGENCALFRRQIYLVDFDRCRRVSNPLNVSDINESTHLCGIPRVEDSSADEQKLCQKCLTASSSILIVERSNNSYCVGGIATPTTDECLFNNDPLYYTILEGSKMKKLLNI